MAALRARRIRSEACVSGGDYLHSPICNPDVDGVKPPPRQELSLPGIAGPFMSAAPKSLPLFYSNPMSYHPSSEVISFTLVRQQAACSPIHHGAPCG
ncbi:hypothetical protein EYF80_063901 [Liparis tanakae]|uniref:Uncharacterized protein n=1 Tax=Liparis tanakae TaxID=230148 RepID=A0A4Z2EB64_9TELE|nr:hypothetical protein EYF80_063901 [Liparis tanakae]